MFRVVTVLLAGLLLTGLVPGQDGSPADRLRKLRAQYDQLEATFKTELHSAKSSEENSKANEKYNQASDEWRMSAVAALRAAGDRPEAFDVIAAVLSRSHVETEEMAGLLRKHHAARPDLGKLFQGMVQDRRGHGRAYVEEVAEKSPVPAVRAQAALALGWQSRWRIAQDGDENLGFGEKLTEDERRKQMARAEKYLTLATTFKDAPVTHGPGTVAAHARAELAGLRNLTRLRVGQPAPDIVGEAVDGGKLKLSDTRGKVTVVVFWASWCGPCLRMIPHEKKLVERMAGKPFALLGVNGDDDRAKARDVTKARGMTWPSFWSGVDGADGPIATAWNVHAWPTIYVLDARGVIRFTGHNDARLDEWVDELIAEAAADGRPAAHGAGR